MLSESDAKWCGNLLKTLQNARNRDKCVFFLVPVHSVLEPADLAAYQSIVSSPKDLRTMGEDLDNGKYTSVENFIADAILCFDNAILFNKTRHVHVAKAAEFLKKVVSGEEAKYLKTREAASAKAATAAVDNITKTIKKTEPVLFIPQCNQVLGMLAGMDTTSLFREPVDPAECPNYPLRIQNPMDFGTIRGMLSDGKIKVPSEFALLVRRVFANCLIFNYQIRGEQAAVIKSIRQRTREMLLAFEDSWAVKFPGVAPSFPQVRESLAAIEELLKIPSVGVNLHAIDNFMDPIPVYFGGDYPAGYLDVVSTPMALATVTQNIVEANIRTLAEFKRDMLLIFSNCEKWIHSEQGFYDIEIEQDARALRKKFNSAFDHHAPLASVANAASKRKAMADEIVAVLPSAVPAIPKKRAQAPILIQSKVIASVAPAHVEFKPARVALKDKYSFCVDEVKEHYIEVQLGKIFTADYFLKAVDPTKYEGYAELVAHPMCLAMVEKKIRADRYRTMEDILRDIYLVRHNTYLYNTGGAGLEIRILVDHFVNNFSFLITLVAKQILLMQESITPSTQATVKASIETAASAISEDFKLLVQVFHGLNPNSSKKTVGDLYASIPDTFFKQPFRDGISIDYERPPAPTPEVLVALRSFFTYDPATLILVKQQVVPLSASVALTPTKAVFKRDTSEVPPVLICNDSANLDFEFAQPARGGKNGSKVAKKRRRDEEFEEVYELPPVIATEDSMDIIVSVARPPSEWEQSCIDILKRILKHDFVDITRPARAGNIVSNFVSPVIELYPQVAESYLSLIETPMDLTIIGKRLEDHGFLDCEDFYEKMVLVFQNAIDYNKPHMEDGEYAQKLVPRCEHLIKYIEWLCLELLPSADDTGVPEPESLGFLRKSVLEAKRQARIEALRIQPIDNIKECMALIKKFDQKKTAKQYSYFAVPVSLKDVPNYSSFVRKPMDFSTVKDKLENGRYVSYMAFIEDIQLIFANAKRFNGTFRESDEFSQMIWDAATMFEERLEVVLYKEFSIEVLERVYWNNIRFVEDEKLRLEYVKKMEKQRLDDLAFRDRETARVKSIDTAFAIDQDRELKRSHALDGLLTSDTVRQSIGLFSDGFFFLPTAEEREEGLLEVKRRRHALFETSWAQWTETENWDAAQSVGCNRSGISGEAESFENLFRSPLKLHGSASSSRLCAVADAENCGSVARCASKDQLTLITGELSRPGNDPIRLRVKKKRVCGRHAIAHRSKQPLNKALPECFGVDASVEVDTFPEVMKVDDEAKFNNAAKNATNSDNQVDKNEDFVAKSSILTDLAVPIGIKIDTRLVPALCFPESEHDYYIVVIAHKLSSGASLLRILSPRLSSVGCGGPINLSGVKYSLKGDISNATFSIRPKVNDCNVMHRLLSLGSENKCFKIKRGRDHEQSEYYVAGSVDRLCSIASNSAFDLGICDTGCGLKKARVALKPFLQRAEGSQRSFRLNTVAPVFDFPDDEVLFSLLFRSPGEEVMQFHQLAGNSWNAAQSKPKNGFCDSLFRYCASSGFLVSTCFESIDAACVLGERASAVSHNYLQHWVVIGEPTEICVEIYGQAFLFQTG